MKARSSRVLVGFATVLSLAMLTVGMVNVVPAAAHAKAGKASGNATFAELVGEPPTYFFPMYTASYWTTAYIPWVSYLMWPPVYQWGKNGKTQFNPTTSLADAPVFSKNATGDTVVTVTLKSREWSDGQPVTTRDVQFWMNLLEVAKTTFAAYVPGSFPDNVKQINYLSTTKYQIVFNGTYSTYWLLGNELDQITPMPQHAWDKTSASGPVGNYDMTPKGAKDVYKFLQSEAKKASTLAGSPLWKVVDGPFVVKSFNSTNGQMSMTPNPKYPWPQSQKISEFTEVPFTSTTAELDALESGQLDVGYVPFTSLKAIPRLESEGYKISYWTQAAFGGLILNYAKSDTAAPILSQLYVRQALTHLVNFKQIIQKIYHGHASYASSPVPNPNTKGQNVTAIGKKDPYPYSISAAKSLLTKHGWHVVPNGTSTCTRPGTGPKDCGKGIKKGAKLEFRIVGTQSASTQYSLLQYVDSQFSNIGASMKVKLVPQGNLSSLAAQCSGKVTKCSWDMELWMGEWPLGWTPYVETGGNTFYCGAASNYGAYCTQKTMDAMINANHQSSQPIAALKKWENYMAKQQIQIFMPMPAYRVVAYKKTLHGVTPLDPYLQIYPQNWYFSK
ncbi:MAG TPA: ABC transporter substrate-binding protein [Acidimicrobiales bacterium]|nr:ABC transporter substrate-binding protein [Acidimicrobiales bacterium]